MTDPQHSELDFLQKLDEKFRGLESFSELSLSGDLEEIRYPGFSFFALTDLDRVSTSAIPGADDVGPVKQDAPRVLGASHPTEEEGDEDLLSGLDVSFGKGRRHPEVVAVDLGRVRIARVPEV